MTEADAAREPEETRAFTFEEDICVHMFSASATLLGVCLTVIGIIRVVITSSHNDTLADDIVALGAVMFMSCCFLSYWAMRSRAVRRLHRVEKIADAFFLIGLSLLAIACMVITYAIV